MYTVIITNERSQELLQEYKMLFAPFADRGDISFCSWNQSGIDIESSVPELYNAIKGKSEWRALVVITPEEDEEGELEYTLYDEKNPFDFLLSKEAGEDLPLLDSQVPLIRLTHMLSGFPALGVKGFDKAFSYVDDETGVEVTVKEGDLDSGQMAQLARQYGHDLHMTYMERHYTEEEKRQHKKAGEKYRFAEERPREVLLVSTRKKYGEDTRELVAGAWQTKLETESSDFWKRNNYPNRCRFLCYDMVDIEHSSFVKDAAKFWLSVLTVAINEMPPSTLQAYRLYRFSAEIDKSLLDDTLNRHLSMLEAARANVKERLTQKTPHAYEQEEDYGVKQDIPVIFEKRDGRHLLVSSDFIGLARDCSNDELKYWREEMTKHRSAFRNWLKAPRRAVDIAAEYARDKADHFWGESRELSKYQVEDLKELCFKLEVNILGESWESRFYEKNIEQEVRKADKEVQKEMELRMKRKTVLLSGLLALFIFLLSFYPYLRQAFANDPLIFEQSVITVLLSLGGLAAGCTAALFKMRKKLTGKVDCFNEVVRNTADQVNRSTREMEGYLSDICTYMKAQSVLQEARMKWESRFSERNLLRAHDLALKEAIQREEAWCTAFGIPVEYEPIGSSSGFFHLEKPPRDNEIYRFSPHTMPLELPINQTGEMVNAPFKFISKLVIEREELYESPN